MPYTLHNNIYGWDSEWDDNGLIRYYLEQLAPAENVYVIGAYTNSRIDVSFLSNQDEIIAKIKDKDYQKIIFTISDQAHTKMADQALDTFVKEFGDRVWTITSANIKGLQIITFLFYWYAALIDGIQKDFPIWAPDYSIINEPKKYKVSCLNNRSSMHRIIFLDAIYSRPYFKEILYSLNELVIYSHPENARIGEHEKIFQNVSKKYLNIVPIHLDLSNSKWCTEMLGYNHPAYKDSYLNVVTENSYEETFLSEKTFKPLAAGQLFLIFGGTGTIQFLRDIGFDVFDDYLDHSYDIEPDWITRAEKIASVLDTWFAADHEKIWAETYHRRLSNSKKFFELDTKDNPFKKIFL